MCVCVRVRVCLCVCRQTFFSYSNCGNCSGSMGGGMGGDISELHGILSFQTSELRLGLQWVNLLIACLWLCCLFVPYTSNSLAPSQAQHAFNALAFKAKAVDEDPGSTSTEPDDDEAHEAEAHETMTTRAIVSSQFNNRHLRKRAGTRTKMGM